MAKKSRNERWSAAEAARLLDRADASGLSDSAFGAKTGVTGQRLSWWRGKLGRRRTRVPGGRAAKAAPQTFVEVRARNKGGRAEAPQDRAHAEAVEIRLVNGRSVLVPESVDLERLGQLLVAVEGRPC